MDLGPYADYPLYTDHGYNGLQSFRFPYYIPFRDDVPVSVVYEDGVTSTGAFFFFSVLEEGEFWEWGPNFDPVPDGKYDCITSVKLSRTISEISDYSFYGCSGLTEIDFGAPERVTIGNRAFGRTSIKKMFIPDNVVLKQESLMRCPLEQVIITNPVPTIEKSVIGQFFRREGIYQQDESEPVTDVYVPDVDAYGAWEPTPKPMLKEGKYSLDDAALGNITIASNIPVYEASTDYQFDQLDEGVYTVSIPVKFTGEREFETTVKYTYIVGDPREPYTTAWCGKGAAWNDVHWEMSDDHGTLTFSGEGAIMDCAPYSNYPYRSYHGYNQIIEEVGPFKFPCYIPFVDDVPVSVCYEDGVTSTGDGFFFSVREEGEFWKLGWNFDAVSDGKYDCITSVKLSRTISEISDYSFYGCSGLTEIDFGAPERVTIGNRAFGRTSIKKMFIPDNVILKRESLMRCPLEQVIITNPVPTVSESYIGQIFKREGTYQQDESAPATDVFVPDVDAYGAWEPAPKPMLKEGKYSLDDAALGNITIASNIPGYEASTDYQFELEEGVYTVSIPVKFTGEREFETTVKYTYTVGDPREPYATAWCGGKGTPSWDVCWALSDDRGTLTFSGEGTILDCSPFSSSAGMYSYSSYHGYNQIIKVLGPLKFPYYIPFADDVPVSVVYKNGVISTGEGFFFSVLEEGEFWKWGPNFDAVSDGKYDCITSVKLSRTISEISDYSFYGCSGLTEIDFGAPERVTIGNRAFGRTSIKKMFIPDNVVLKQESLMRCPLEQVIITNPVPTIEKSVIGQFFRREGIYQQDEGEPVTDVYVPDVEAYAKWEPMPKPMLKEGKYSLEEAALGNITIASNIPGYEAATDYQFDQLTEGRHTVAIPVKFIGERVFETTVKYTYTVGDASTSINNIEGDGFSVKISDGMIVVSGNSGPIVIFNITGQKVYEGAETRIQLPSGIYFVNCGGKTIKTKL
ncbi:MAG: leucine-rich repeat domain-containing protein [Bacteroides sp.]|nr:leucine-rich repeat domain-containing protein [Bacteroides sp.]